MSWTAGSRKWSAVLIHKLWFHGILAPSPADTCACARARTGHSTTRSIFRRSPRVILQQRRLARGTPRCYCRASMWAIEKEDPLSAPPSSSSRWTHLCNYMCLCVCARSRACALAPMGCISQCVSSNTAEVLLFFLLRKHVIKQNFRKKSSLSVNYPPWIFLMKCLQSKNRKKLCYITTCVYMYVVMWMECKCRLASQSTHTVTSSNIMWHHHT